MSKKGYNHTICSEDLILDKEEYDEQTWAIYCKLFCGLEEKPETISTIKVNIASVGFWRD